MSSDQLTFVEKYILLRQNNGKPNELIEFFSESGKIIDNVTNKKTYFGKNEILEYFESSVKPWVNPTVSKPELNIDGTYSLTLTFSKFGITIKTVIINFKFENNELLFEQVRLD